jgi:hypothetical protein
MPAVCQLLGERMLREKVIDCGITVPCGDQPDSAERGFRNDMGA